MITKGIRITEGEHGYVSTELADILREIKNHDDFFWVILWSDITPNKGEGEFIILLEEKINNSKDGIHFTWDDLKALSTKIFQTIDLVLIGDRSERNLHNYNIDREMYESCDIVIQMIDSSYWEIFSKDESFIQHLGNNFKKTKFINSDFTP